MGHVNDPVYNIARMRHTIRTALQLCALCVAVSGTAAAQSLFLDGAAFASIERRNNVEPPGSLGASLKDGGTVAGGGLTVGTWLTPRVTLRLEVALPATLRREATFSQVFPGAGGIPQMTYSYSFQLLDQGRTFSTLLGYHTARRHGVQLGYLGGAAFVVQPQRIRNEFHNPYVVAVNPIVGSPGGVTVRDDVHVDETRTTLHSVAAAVGLDADVALSAHISAVPQMRVVGLSNGLAIRPGVAVRMHW